MKTEKEKNEAAFLILQKCSGGQTSQAIMMQVNQAMQILSQKTEETLSRKEFEKGDTVTPIEENEIVRYGYNFRVLNTVEKIEEKENTSIVDGVEKKEKNEVKTNYLQVENLDNPDFKKFEVLSFPANIFRIVFSILFLFFVPVIYGSVDSAQINENVSKDLDLIIGYFLEKNETITGIVISVIALIFRFFEKKKIKQSVISQIENVIDDKKINTEKSYNDNLINIIRKLKK